MKLFVIRHTSVAVDSGICYGQTDVMVAGSFEEEKEIVSNKIAGVQFDKVYISPLSRCKLLAESLFEKKQLVSDCRLKELDFGDWELKTWDAIYSEPYGKEWMNNYQNLPTLNGESYLEMVKRVTDFYEDLKVVGGETVAIVAHAGVIRILKSIIEERPIEDLFKWFKPKYGSITEFII